MISVSHSCSNHSNLILDTKLFTIKNCAEDINNKIISSHGAGNRVLYLSDKSNFNDIDTNIVYNIISSLINDKNIIQQYRKLCYNILVEQKETIIFEDYSNKCCLLSSWLSDLMFSICSDKHHNGYKCFFDENEKSTYKKTFKNNKPRVVFINDIYEKNDKKFRYNKIDIKKHIDFLKNLGIKNIIVKYSIDNNQYNYKKYIEYIVENKEKITSLFSKKSDDWYPNIECIDCETKRGNYDDIFYLTSMLFNNFLKFCCSLNEDI